MRLAILFVLIVNLVVAYSAPTASARSGEVAQQLAPTAESSPATAAAAPSSAATPAAQTSATPAAQTSATPSAQTEQSSQSTHSKSEDSVSQAAAAAIQATVVSPSAEQIRQIEIDAFSHAFASDTNEQRICRLEQFVFGKQFGGDLAKRFLKLRRALAPKERRNEGQPVISPDSNSSRSSTSSLTSTSSSTSASTSSASPPPPPSESRVSLIDVMNRGIDNYNRHRYQNAEDDFEECCAMAPGMSRCYSYLAITKMQLNLRQAAIDSFRMSNMLDPFGTYGRYARQCLIVLAGDEAMRKGPPVDSRKILDTAMSQIDKQSSENITRHNQEGNAIAASRLNYRPDSSYVDSRVQSTYARTDAALRSAHTAESANNLKHQLAVKKMKGDANLRAWGTTLTTRYYGNETYLSAPYYIPRERPMELKAIVQSLQNSLRSSKARVSPGANHPRSAQQHNHSSKSHAHKTNSKQKRG